MDAAKKSGSKSDHKKGKTKKRIIKINKYRSIKFDKERFFLVLGLGFVSSAIGLWIIWATKTASQSVGDTTAQKLVHFFPESISEILAFIVGNLFVLFGVISFLICLKSVVQYIAGKLQN